MTRVLICGLCPLPFENTLRNDGPGIRTWQFARGLANAGHTTHVLAMMIDGSYESPPDLIECREAVHIERVSEARFMDPAFIRRRTAAIQPDALVGATIHGSYAIAQTEPDKPFWADQFGHIMAEAQALAALERNNWPISHFWHMAQLVGQWCDRLSTVSVRQSYAAIGELGALGRLNPQSTGYEFTAVVPCALSSERTDHLPGLKPKSLRGSLIPEDAFVVLWSGGFNAWSDVETLFKGVEAAMKTNPTVHFVSTGAAINGDHLGTYSQFETLVEHSDLRERFHLLGWVEGDRIANILSESDLGVVADRPIYEGLLGSKNRIVEWMASGLAVAYNRCGDLGETLADEDLAFIFAIGDSSGLASSIQRACRNPTLLNDYAQRAREYALREFSFEKTTEPLVQWSAKPAFAPDRSDGKCAAVAFEQRSLSQDIKAVARHTRLGRSAAARKLWRRLKA